MDTYDIRIQINKLTNTLTTIQRIQINKLTNILPRTMNTL